MTSRRGPRGLGFEAFVVVLGAVEVASVVVGSAHPRWGVAAVTAASALVLLGKRWLPLVVSILAFSLILVELALSPKSTDAEFFGTFVTFAVAGAINSERDAVVAWLAGVGLLAYGAWADPLGKGLPDFLLPLAVGSAFWGAGFIGVRRSRHAADLARRAYAAEHDREQRTARAVLDERGRIARELHDVVSHGLAVAIVQTAAARATLVDGAVVAADVERHLAHVETAARESLAEMRRMLGLLADGSAAAPTPAPPAPDLRQLPLLVARTEAAGLRVHLDGESVALETLPAGLQLAMFRVVQESLTNAVNHAPGASVEVVVRGNGESVSVRVVNSAPTRVAAPMDGGGRGLVGMRERVALYDGSLAAGPTPDGGYAVVATFTVPVTEAAPVAAGLT